MCWQYHDDLSVGSIKQATRLGRLIWACGVYCALGPKIPSRKRKAAAGRQYVMASRQSYLILDTVEQMGLWHGFKISAGGNASWVTDWKYKNRTRADVTSS